MLMVLHGRLDAIRAMRRLEQGIYRNHKPPAICQAAAARAAMIQWTFQILRFLLLDATNIAPIVLDYVDRYVAVHEHVLQDRSKYLLVSMTALYTAIKVHGTGALLDPASIRTLSRESFTVQDIESQELHLLTTLQWRLCPPTAAQYVHQFLYLMPCREQRETVEVATLQLIDLSYASGLSSVPASQLAVQSFLTAVRNSGFGDEQSIANDIACLLDECHDRTVMEVDGSCSATPHVFSMNKGEKTQSQYHDGNEIFSGVNSTSEVLEQVRA